MDSADDAGVVFPDALTLPPDVVQVWLIPIDLPVDRLECLWSLLDDEERRRASLMATPSGQSRFVVAHAAVRAILAGYLGVSSAELRFIRGAYGKPALANTRQSSLHFNLARSHDLAVCAVASGREVGIDIERIRADAGDKEIVRHFFSAHEQAELEALPETQWSTGFFNCWTRKEAYIKARGEGLSLPLESFDVSLTPGAPARLLGIRCEPPTVEPLSLYDLKLSTEYAAAVAAIGFDWHVQCRRWVWPASPTGYLTR